LVLEDDAPDGDTDGLSERAEEGEERDGESDVVVCAGGLQTELHGGEEDAGAEAGDEVEEDPGGDGGVDVEEHHEAAAERGDCPPGPDGPAVASCFRDDDPGDHGRGRDGETFREGGHAGDDGGVALDGLVVERDVIDDGPEHHAVHDGVEVRDPCRPVRKDGKRHQGLLGYKALVQAKSDYTRQPEDQWDECLPAAPGEHDAAPGDGDNSRGGGRQEEDHAEPIHTGELRGEVGALEAEVEEEGDHDEADAAEGEVEPEDPPPGDCAFPNVQRGEVHTLTIRRARVRDIPFSANAPPTMGPVVDPIAHIAPMRPKYFPRSRRGTRSVTMISVRAMMPPPPMPWRERPARRTVKLLLTPQMMAPTVKKRRAVKS